ncbi:MAG: hypothetical protein ACYDER_15610 [Ktedonobacteraceae bacterium]
MQRQLLANLPLTLDEWMFDSSWAFQPIAEGLLGLVWESKAYRAVKKESEIHLQSFNCEMGKSEYSDVYHYKGIADNLFIHAEKAQAHWFLTWEGHLSEHDPPFIALCPIHWDIPVSSAKRVIIDQSLDRMTRMGPVLSVAGTEQSSIIIHLRPGIDDTETTLICINRVKIENLEDHPQEFIAELALRATICQQNASWYMILFDAEWDRSESDTIGIPLLKKNRSKTVLTEPGQFFTKSKAKSENTQRSVLRAKPYWRFWVTRSDSLFTDPSWKYPLRIRIPATSDPYSEFWDDVVTGAAIISGPHWKLSQQNEQQTIIVAVGLIKKEAIGLPEEQARPLRGGELLCLSQDGQVVQECKEEIVEQVELCLVGDTVIGVDRIQRRWRLWRWEPLAGKEQFTTVQWLDEEVVHAHVVTNHENSDPQGTHFWLVEERPKGLVVSRRDGQILEETEEPITLTGWSLPYALDRPVGEWDWPIKKGIIGHNDALLLIAADEENRMVLYRVEASYEAGKA